VHALLRHKACLRRSDRGQKGPIDGFKRHRPEGEGEGEGQPYSVGSLLRPCTANKVRSEVEGAQPRGLGAGCEGKAKEGRGGVRGVSPDPGRTSGWSGRALRARAFVSRCIRHRCIRLPCSGQWRRVVR
jgi:hypothetical protein